MYRIQNGTQRSMLWRVCVQQHARVFERYATLPCWVCLPRESGCPWESWFCLLTVYPWPVARGAACPFIHAASRPEVGLLDLTAEYYPYSPGRGTVAPKSQTEGRAGWTRATLQPWLLTGCAAAAALVEVCLEQSRLGGGGTTEPRTSTVISVMTFASRCCLSSFGPWRELVNPQGLYVGKTWGAHSAIYSAAWGGGSEKQFQQPW